MKFNLIDQHGTVIYHHTAPKSKGETGYGHSLTQPRLAVNIAKNLKAFSAPSAQQIAKGYYEELGQELPKNFDRMDKLEQLHALAEVRDNAERLRKKIRTQQEAQLKKRQEQEITNTVNKKIQEQLNNIAKGEQKSDK